MIARAFVVASIAIVLATAAPALAQSPSQRALTLGYEGDGLYARGRWAEAYDRFAEADQLAHSPVFVLYMARCRKNAGKLIEARSAYERVAHESVPSDAPKPFRDAVSDAAAERDEVARRVPSVKVTVTGAPSPAAISIDGESVPAGKTEIELDPGQHEVKASSGDLSAKKTVTLAEGARGTPVELSLARATATAPATPPDTKGSAAPAVIAFSLGAVGMGIGAVTGAIAAGKASDVKPGCVGTHCRSEDKDKLDSAKTLATVSTIGFIAGGAAVAVGAVLLIVRPGGTSARTAGTWVGVGGAF